MTLDTSAGDRSTGDRGAVGGLHDQFHLDHDRASRRGYAEAVFCEPKTVDQAVAIAKEIVASGSPTLFTRVREDQIDPLREVLGEATWYEDAALLAWPGTPPPALGGKVLVVSAGTSDLRVAREAELTCRYLGRDTELIMDVGVAGIHRILGRVDELTKASAIIVVAGMDGALPSVVAGLVSAPVVAVPTSVGYGASFGGLAPLLSMLNACAPGVGVVNIDNGYGAGHLAAQIAAPTS